METILTVQNLTKYYGSGGGVTKALDGVSFTLDKGSFTAVMGASGSGKSTLLNVISTIDRPSAGSVVVEGRNVAQMKDRELAAFRRDRLGFVFQDYNLLDTLTAGENITLPLNLQRLDPASTAQQLHKAASALGITDQLDKFPRELSGGQRQRAAAARALITSPALILADEPTGALDSANSKALMKLFEQMNQTLGATILMVTHDALVGSYAQRVLFLKDGRLMSEVLRGQRDRQAMYQDILAVTASLGGADDAL